MMKSKILQFVDFTKQKSKYLKNKTFFLQIKNSLIIHQDYFMAEDTFVGDVTIKWRLFFDCFPHI